MGFVELEQAGKKALEQFPVIKRTAKRVYQVASVATSSERIKSEGGVVRVSPDDGFEYYYGYYDKSPWDATNRYIIGIQVKQAYKSVAPQEPGIVGVIDTLDNNRFLKLGVSHAWNVQQSCMAQWMGPDFKTRILYNDFRNGHYCAVIYNFEKKSEEKVLPMAAYDVARDGSFIMSLDFSRLHRMRPGYGYSNLPEETKGELCPDKGCIWKVNVATGKVEELFKYTDFASFEPDESMKEAEHKVNHIMISPNGKRFMVLHRWFQNGKKHTRLVTVNVDKSEMYNLSDDVFVSHCYWKNDGEILSFLRKKESGDHYYLLKDKTREYEMFWPELNTDGHCSYSPDGKFIITDTYPNRKRIASVYLCTEEDNRSRRIARVFSPFRYDNDCRCDLHPRWDRIGEKVCIDSVHEGRRALYVIDMKDYLVEPAQDERELSVSVVIPTHNRADLLPRAVQSVLNQTYRVKEINVVSDGSEDSTEDIMKEMEERHPQIHFHSYHPGRGGNYARNYGIQMSTGDVVAFLDDDDEWHADKIEKQIALLKADKEIGLVCTGTNRVFVEQGTSNAYIPPAPYDCSKEILLKNCIGSTTTVMVRRELFDQVGGFDEALPALQDYDMWVRLCQITKVGVVKSPCVEYYNYETSGQISQNTQKYINAEKAISKKYEEMISKLTPVEQKQRRCYFDMLLSKKGMRNGQTKIAIGYGWKAVKDNPGKSSIVCFGAALVPYKLTMAVQRKVKNNGIS